MHNLKKVLEKKKMHETRPIYGKRKLSIGLVSCILGIMFFTFPNSTFAKTISTDNVTNITKDNIKLKDSENKESKGKIFEDEAKIKNHNDKERYRTSEMEAGKGVVKSLTNEEKDKMNEGLKYNTINPKSSDKDKKTYGIEVEVDKEKGKRTYTYIGISDTKNPSPSKDVENDAIESGDTLIKDPTTYKPEAKLKVEGNDVNITLTQEDLKHINSKDNNKIIVAWKDKYKKNTTNSNKQYFNGDNFVIKFAVNPYPNENDELSIMKVETEKQSQDKYFVKGQLIRTGAYISNVLKKDQTRIAGEVYHPDGTVLEDAKAFIITDENIERYKKELQVDNLKVGEIIFSMPKGALDDENSVFNTDKYRGIQNLKVKMYARPRTEDEFKAALPSEDKVKPGQDDVDKEDRECYEINGNYTGAVDGKKEIIHNGEKVIIDKQGIDRYDHYNLLGDLTINLDDTRDHDQVFDTKVNKPTDKMTKVKPDTPVEININDDFTKVKDNPRETSTSMNTLREEKKVKAEFDKDFLEKAKAEGWEISINDGDISKFTVKAPKTAKAGDFIAIPLTYTYTNGSNDTHWFHFVVQDTDNNRPEYYASVGLPGESLSNKPIIISNPKKYEPQEYTLDATEFKDDKGNVWTNVKVDYKSGVVTADVPDNGKIVGGERLFVPVKIKYIDTNTKEEKFEYVKAEFVAKPKFQTEVTTSFEKDIPFEIEETIDETLPVGEIVVDESGEIGKVKVNFKQVVVNGKKGIIDEKGKFVEGVDKFIKEEKVTKEKKNRKVRVGVKPIEETVTIPKTVEYIFDDTKPAGEETVEEEGNDGVITIKTSKDKKTGKITVIKETTTEAKPKKICRGTMVTGEVSHEEMQEIPFEVEIIEDENLEAGKSEIVTKGVAGSKTIKYTQKIKNGKADGKFESKVTKEVKPVKQVIKVGKKKTENKEIETSNVPVEIDYVYDNNLDVTVAKTGELISGKVETIVTNKYNPETGKIETVKNTVIKSAKQKIIIGTHKFTKELEHKLKEIIPFETKIEFDDTLKSGEQQITEAGENGEKTKTVKQKFENGKETGNEVVAEKVTKNKKDRVIKVGTMTEGTHTHTEEIPFEYEVIYDDNMDAGKYEVVTPGKKGTRTTTWTIKNSKVEDKPKVTEKKPVKAIIKVGKKPVESMCPINLAKKEDLISDKKQSVKHSNNNFIIKHSNDKFTISKDKKINLSKKELKERNYRYKTDKNIVALKKSDNIIINEKKNINENKKNIVQKDKMPKTAISKTINSSLLVQTVVVLAGITIKKKKENKSN